jgi:hypothetical protein
MAKPPGDIDYWCGDAAPNNVSFRPERSVVEESGATSSALSHKPALPLRSVIPSEAESAEGSMGSVGTNLTSAASTAILRILNANRLHITSLPSQRSIESAALRIPCESLRALCG